jgi:hypothetical protein
VVLLGGVAGCADDDEPALGGGFDVAAGSELVGVPFPNVERYDAQGTPVPDDGFRALLLVEGDPVPVIASYLDQAAELGIDVPLTQSSDAAEQARAPCVGVEEQVDSFVCVVGVRTSVEDDPRSVRLTFTRGLEGDDVPFSHLLLSYATTRAEWSGPIGHGPVESPPPTPDNLHDVADLDILFDQWEPVRQLPVADGSALVAQWPLIGTGVGTPSALVEVTGDPATVFNRYVESLEPHVDRTRGFDPADGPLGRLTRASAGTAGGDAYVLRMLETDHDGTWLWIDSSYD